jgi:hypothetical protein
MSITAIGRIEKKDFGFGVWTLITEAGETYELKEPPPALCQAHPKVRVEGRVRDDIMTVAMIGPVLEVESFTVLA